MNTKRNDYKLMQAAAAHVNRYAGGAHTAQYMYDYYVLLDRRGNPVIISYLLDTFISKCTEYAYRNARALA